MNDETFNLSIRRFLKMVGVKSQREIEQAVARACAEGRIQGGKALAVTVTLRMPGVDLDLTVDGTIELE
jgi:hypothetical protein